MAETDSRDPDPRPFRELPSDEIPLAFVAFLDVHRACPDDDVELGRTGALAVAYCAHCDDIRTYTSTG